MAQKVSLPGVAAAQEYAAEGESPDDVEAIRAAVLQWHARSVAAAEVKIPSRSARFATWSGLDVPAVPTPPDGPPNYPADPGGPRDYPFTPRVPPPRVRRR